MNNFMFNCPTRVIFGKETEGKVGEEIKACGGTRVLVHYGSESARKSGLLNRVEESLQKAGLTYFLLGGVVPNPLLSLVREGIALCKKEDVDFVLAVGGGSSIDSSKAIALGALYENDVWEVYDGFAQFPVQKALPVASILTLAAAGSETSNASVITNGKNKQKRGFKTEIYRPKFAIMNPELTYTLPAYQTSAGIVDILMHTMERYFVARSQNQMTDLIAEAVLRNVIANGRILMENPNDYEARSEIMWAGSLSHNDLTGLGYVGDYATHQIEHELSGMFGVTHGAGLASLWGSWARYVYKADAMRFVQFANKVWDIEINYDNLEETVFAGIKATENYFASLNMPTNITSLIGRAPTAQEINDMAESCVFFGRRTLGSIMKLTKEDVVKIYNMAI